MGCFSWVSHADEIAMSVVTASSEGAAEEQLGGAMKALHEERLRRAFR